MSFLFTNQVKFHLICYYDLEIFNLEFSPASQINIIYWIVNITELMRRVQQSKS